jgi:hypothetical protein
MTLRGSDGRMLTGPKFRCDGTVHASRKGGGHEPCGGAAKVFLTTEGLWLCGDCVQRTKAAIAKPTPPAGDPEAWILAERRRWGLGDTPGTPIGLTSRCTTADSDRHGHGVEVGRILQAFQLQARGGGT